MVSKGRYILVIEIIVVFLGNSLVRSVITDVRLVDGPTSNKGTVEIRIDNGTWETTCGRLYWFDVVIVICRQLGFAGASRAIQDTPYGQNLTTTSVLFCNGGEANLDDCEFFPSLTCSTSGAASCHGESYLGCFVDLWNDRVFTGDSLIRDPDLTISDCIQFCNSSIRANYVYGGVQNGNECFCGEASDNYTRHGMASDDNCSIPCSGDPTDSCGAAEYIAVFKIFQPTGPPTTVAETSPTITTTITTTATTSTSSTSTSSTTSTPSTSTSSTFASTSGHVDVNTVEILPTTLEQEAASPKTPVRQEVAITIAEGILLAFVALFGIIIVLMYLHVRRANIALKQSVSDREGQELDPYTSSDATTLNQPAYDDTVATTHGSRGHTNAIEGVEYSNQRIVEQTARVNKSNLGGADENTEPGY